MRLLSEAIGEVVEEPGFRDLAKRDETRQLGDGVLDK